MQKRAVKSVARRSKEASEEAYPNVLERVKNLGFSEDDLKRALRYIRDEAPIIIHFKPQEVMQYFVKDTHYRNQFETNSSNGTLDHNARVDWEARLFESIYDEEGVTGFDRAKYGVLNVFNHPIGVSDCYWYGLSYFVLKGIRLRTTFCDQDSSAEEAKVATCEYYAHVLDCFMDEEIKSLLDLCVERMVNPNATSEASLMSGNYKEIQIHGPIAFDEHIAAVRLEDDLDGDTLALVKEFGEIFGVTDITSFSLVPTFPQ